MWYDATATFPNDGVLAQVGGLPDIATYTGDQGGIISLASTSDIQSIVTAPVIATVNSIAFRRRSDGNLVTNADMQPFNNVRLAFQITYRADI